MLSTIASAIVIAIIILNAIAIALTIVARIAHRHFMATDTNYAARFYLRRARQQLMRR